MISVIVPVYNCGAYLPRCVDSLRQQTFRDLQIILVDDGSTDGTAALCDDFAAEDARVTVIHRPNGGVSSARNAGMIAAAGEYIAFADADDYADSDHLMNLYRLMQTHGCDVAICSFISEDETLPPEKRKRQRPCKDTGSVRELCLDHDSAVCELLAGGAVGGYVWNKLYRREVLTGARFENGTKLLEDLLFNYQVFRNVTSAVFCDVKTYHYVQRGQSAMHRAFGEEHRKMVATARTICMDTAAQSRAIADAGKGLLATTILWVADVMAEYGPYDSELFRRYQAEFKPLRSTYLRLSRVPLSYRLSGIFFSMGFGVYRRAVKAARRLLG